MATLPAMTPLVAAILSTALVVCSSVLLAAAVRRAGAGLDAEGGWKTAGTLVLDVWGPIVLALPFIGMCGTVDTRLDASGWPIVGGPVVLGLIGMSLAMLLSGAAVPERTTEEAGTVHGRALACWGATGIALVMIAAANDLTVLVGQTAFAIAAVMLWLNTPSHRDASAESHAPGAGLLLLGAIVLAAVNAVLLWMSDGSLLPLITGAAIVGGLWVFVCASTTGGAVRLAGWTATIGVLLAVGVLALRVLLPQVVVVARLDRPEAVDPNVVHGFGTVAIEATAMALLPGLAYLATKREMPSRFAIGVVCLLLTATLIITRLLAMGG